MKKISTRSNSRIIKAAVALASIVLFVIGAGAPLGGGSGAPGCGG
jgi:hypothetical protein